MLAQELKQLEDTAELLCDILLKESAQSERYIVALAGPPASGKSTLCQALHEKLEQHTTVATVPMDGYHYDNHILDQLDLRDRKGAPNTFDITGLRLFLQGLTNQTSTMAAPVFDRQQDLARSSARLIQVTDKIILVEGNYLLCKQPPWDELQQYFDYTVLLRNPVEVLETRLVQRWLDNNHTRSQATERANHNDLPNAKYVLDNSSEADCKIGKTTL